MRTKASHPPEENSTRICYSVSHRISAASPSTLRPYRAWQQRNKHKEIISAQKSLKSGIMQNNLWTICRTIWSTKALMEVLNHSTWMAPLQQWTPRFLIRLQPNEQTRFYCLIEHILQPQINPWSPLWEWKLGKNVLETETRLLLSAVSQHLLVSECFSSKWKRIAKTGRIRIESNVAPRQCDTFIWWLPCWKQLLKCRGREIYPVMQLASKHKRGTMTGERFIGITTEDTQ